MKIGWKKHGFGEKNWVSNFKPLLHEMLLKPLIYQAVNLVNKLFAIG